jgi:hypothetical protein
MLQPGCSWYIPGIYQVYAFGLILVYTRHHIPGIYQVWKYMGIYQVYTRHIPPISPTWSYAGDIPGIYRENAISGDSRCAAGINTSQLPYIRCSLPDRRTCGRECASVCPNLDPEPEPGQGVRTVTAGGCHGDSLPVWYQLGRLARFNGVSLPELKKSTDSL